MKNDAVILCLAAVLLQLSGCIKGDNVVGPGAQGGWSLERDSRATLYFHAITFVDHLTGWAVGDSGVIVHTDDGGATWAAQASGTTEPLKCIHFATPQRGWIGGGSNSIGSTTNGGQSWTWQHPAGKPKRIFMGVSFVGDSIGWIVDNNSGILHTTDGGATWQPQVSGTTWAITAVQFLDANEGWAVSTNMEVLHTTDGGTTWTSKTLNTLDYGGSTVPVYNNIFFRTRSKGWIATNVMATNVASTAAPVVATSDVGISWTTQSTPEHQSINALCFVDDQNGWAACNGGVLVSTNGGTSWNFELEASDDRMFVDICFTDHSHGWALTSHGSIYQYH